MGSLTISQGSRGVLSDAFAMVTLGLIAGWYYILIATTLLLLCAFVVHRSILAAFVLAFFVTEIAVPYEPPALAPNWFTKSWVFDAWRAYFGWETVLEEPLKPGEKYLMAEFPHALYPMGQLLSYGVIDAITPEHRVTGVVASVLLRTPVLRHFYYATGTRAATVKSIERTLHSEGNVAVVVGGIAEMFLDTTHSERIYLRRRKGFVKVAMREGAHIVPVFFFGNTKTLLKVNSSVLQMISRKLQASIVLFYGRWGTPVPFRHPIKMVAGKPIHVSKCNDPSDDAVQATLDKVIDALKALYDKHRPDWEKRPLIIE